MDNLSVNVSGGCLIIFPFKFNKLVILFEYYFISMFFVQASLELLLYVNLNQIAAFHRLIIQA